MGISRWLPSGVSQTFYFLLYCFLSFFILRGKFLSLFHLLILFILFIHLLIPFFIGIFHWLWFLGCWNPRYFRINHKYELDSLICSSKSLEVDCLCWEIIENVNTIYLLLFLFCLWFGEFCFFLYSDFNILIIEVSIGSFG